MKKIALFVSMVVIFGGLYTFAYLNNSKSINASNGKTSISKACECEDPAKCKEEGKCDGECEESESCSTTTCESIKQQVKDPIPYTPPCCKDKENK
jgi:hypothetical protein